MKVTNMVLTTRIGVKLNLPALANAVNGAQYHPHRFRGLILKLEKGTCLVFHNGQVVIVGVTSRREGEQAMRDLVHVVRDVGEDVKNSVLCLKNIVAYHDFGTKVELCALYNKLRSHYDVSYEPEISPALMLKLPYTVRIFHNGK